MNPKIEALMAHGRIVGVTQRIVTAVNEQGRTLRLASHEGEVRSFSSCGYLGLEYDPRVRQGAIDAIASFGVGFSSSRTFMRSALYAEAEALLTQLFRRPVLLTQSTTLAHATALPVLLEASDVVLIDKQVHHSVQVALSALGPRGPRVRHLPHANFNALDEAVSEAVAGGARRVWYCADGVYSMFGDRLDTAALGAVMRRHEVLHAYLDDAHGMSWCGTRGGGALIDAALPWERVVLATSLSKGFGAGGGLLVLPDEATRLRIGDVGPSMMFSIQLPPPMLGAICAAARIHLEPEFVELQRAVQDRIDQLTKALAADPLLASRVVSTPGSAPTPIRYIVLGRGEQAVSSARVLLDQGMLVNPVAFPAVPVRKGGLRVTVTAAHRLEDITTLVRALSALVQAGGEA